MEFDRKRKLIIGALDSRHDDVDQESCPGIGTLSAKNRNPKCKSGFYVISYRDPRHLEQVGKFNEVPAGTRRAASTAAITSGPAVRRGVTTSPTSARSPRARAATAGRSGSPTSAIRGSRGRSSSRYWGATTGSRTPRRRQRRLPGLRVGVGPRRAARIRDERQVARPEDRRRAPGAPVGSGAAGRRVCRAARRCRPAADDFIHNANRPTDGKVRAAGVGRATSR